MINSVPCSKYNSEQMGYFSGWTHSNKVALNIFITK